MPRNVEYGVLRIVAIFSMTILYRPGGGHGPLLIIVDIFGARCIIIANNTQILL